MSEKLNQNGIVFELDPQTFTAKVIRSQSVANTVFIPRSVIHESNEYTVMSIEESAFEGNQLIDSVLFDEDSEVKTIGKNIFKITNIKKFSIPAKLEFIEEGWCQCAQSLTEINISPNNKYFKLINDKVLIMSNQQNDQQVVIFASRNIRSIEIPSYVTRIASYSFQNCNSLESITFESHSKLNSIGKNAFQFTKLTNFYIPPNLQILEEGWCSQMDLLKDIQLSINNQFFEYADNSYLIRKSDTDEEKVLVFVKRSIVDSIVPSCVTRIGSCSFGYCKSLNSISFKKDSQIKTIGKYAFYLSSLKSLTLPSSIEHLEEGCFINANSLNTIVTDPKSDNFIFIDETFLIYQKTILLFARRDITEAIIPSFITRIGQYAFENCFELKKVLFSENSSLIEISDSAFSCCIQLLNVLQIPSTLKRIGKYAFQCCECIESIEFDVKRSSLEVIDDYAFDSCQNLQSFSIIPKSVKKIGISAFGGSEALKSISFEEGAMVEYIGSDAFSSTSIKMIQIPSKVKGLSERFLMRTSDDIQFEISNENEFNEFLGNELLITKIDDETVLNFANQNIKDVLIPSNVTRIGSSSFESRKQLKSISFENNSNIKSIGNSAFAYSSLEKLEIPESLEIIEDNWLFVVRNLNVIELSPLNNHFSLIDNKLLVRKIENNKFLNGFDLLFAPRNIESVVIPSFIVRINNSAFSYCSKLKSISFEKPIENQEFSSLKEIGYSSFSNCTSLKSIVSIPSSLRIVNGFCFSQSENLTSLEFWSEEMTFNYGSFFSCISLSLLAFENAKKIIFRFGTFFNAKNEVIVYVQNNAEMIMKSY